MSQTAVHYPDEAKQESLFTAFFGAPSLPSIAGLHYEEQFLSLEEEAALLQAADAGSWQSYWQRRTQSYGMGYRDLSEAKPVLRQDRPIPPWLQPLRQRIATRQWQGKAADQISINEYLPGQGIAPHIDRPAFDAIVILSLGSHTVMDLLPQQGSSDQAQQLTLHRRSCLVLDGAARHQWQHGIAPRRSDQIDGVRCWRKRRLSITFRTILSTSRTEENDDEKVKEAKKEAT